MYSLYYVEVHFFCLLVCLGLLSWRDVQFCKSHSVLLCWGLPLALDPVVFVLWNWAHRWCVYVYKCCLLYGLFSLSMWSDILFLLTNFFFELCFITYECSYSFMLCTPFAWNIFFQPFTLRLVCLCQWSAFLIGNKWLGLAF
jgi:hypothetical protein